MTAQARSARLRVARAATRVAGAAALVAACGTPSQGNAGPAEVLPPDSSVDMALAFDGAKTYASMGTAGFPSPLVQQTVSFWMNASSSEGDQTIVTMNKDLASGMRLNLVGGLLTVTSVYSGDTFAQVTTALSLNQWHHVAYLFDGSSTEPHHTLYLDGVVAATSNAEPGHRTPTTGFLGSDGSEQRIFHGMLDELRVWTVARTSDQIAEEIAGQAPEQEPPDLVTYYTFNEASGARVVDHSGRGNHALLGDGIAAYMPARVPSGVAAARKQ